MTPTIEQQIEWLKSQRAIGFDLMWEEGDYANCDAVLKTLKAYDRDRETIRDLAAALRECESLLQSRFASSDTQEGRLAVAMVNRIRGLLP